MASPWYIAKFQKPLGKLNNARNDAYSKFGLKNARGPCYELQYGVSDALFFVPINICDA